MSARTSSRLVGVFVVVAVVLVTTLVLTLRGREGRAALNDRDTATLSGENEPEKGRETLSDAPRERPEVQRTIAEPALLDSESPSTAELANAVWIRGRVMIPDGTPSDERAVVVAVGREFGSKKLHKSVVAADGTFRVAFSSLTKKATLRIEARYLFLEQPQAVKLDDATKDVVLTPALGGMLRGRVKLAASAQDFAPELVGSTVASSGWKESGGFRTRTTKLDLKLEFELGGLDPEINWRTSCSAKGFATVLQEASSVKPGTIEEIEFTIERGASVSGVIRDESGAVVIGANVQTDARRMSVAAAMKSDSNSDAEGRFTCTDLRAGDALFVVEARGFVSKKLEMIALSAGEARTLDNVVLSRGQSISGLVQFADGRPGADVLVTAKPDEEVPRINGMFGDPSDPSAQTDAAGAFTIWGLSSGKHEVFARSAKMELAPPAPGEKRGARGRMEARRADVAAGTSGITLVFESGSTISGRVVDDLGVPLDAFRIELSRQGANPWETTGRRNANLKSADGTFAIPGISDGSWEIYARHKDGRRSKAVLVKLPEEVHRIDLVVPRFSKLRGSVLDPQGTPVAGATLRIDREENNLRVWSNENAAQKSDERGAFEFDTQPGSFQLSASHPNWAQSAKETIEIAPGSSSSPITLSMRIGGTIAGRVSTRTGEPAPGRVVSIWGEGASQQDTTDAGGHFRFERIAAGETQVNLQASEKELAESRGPNGEVDWQLAQPENGQARVVVVDGQVVEVDLGGMPKGGVKVTGVISAAAPIARAKLHFYARAGSQNLPSRAVLSDASGRYEVTLAGPGVYGVMIECEGGSRTQTECDVPPGPSFVFDIALSTCRIKGRVFDGLGNPVARAQVSARAEEDREDGGTYYGSADTDGDGRFVLSALSPAKYEITARPQGNFRGNTWSQSQARATAGGIELAAGATVDDIELRFPLTSTVRGTVRDVAGKSVAGAAIQVRDVSADAEEGYGGAAQSASDGSFSVEVPLGRFTLSARLELDIAESETIVVSNGVVTEVALTMRPGNILIACAENAAGEVVKARLRLRDVRGRDYGTFHFREEAGLDPVPEGARRFAGLPDGEYTLSAEFKGHEMREERLNLRGGAKREVRLRLTEPAETAPK